MANKFRTDAWDKVFQLSPLAKPVPWIAGLLVLLGLLLSGIRAHPAWYWSLLLVATGTFGPGLLRELGWLKDKDEFQMQAARRAGYHAFLATGFLAFFWMAFFRSGTRHTVQPEELATFFAALLWFTWLFSSLVNYWGARKTAQRMLLLYGSAWLLFCLAEGMQHPMEFLMQSLLVLPFFLLAWTSSRWPKSTGVLLLATSVFFFLFFRFHRPSRSSPAARATTALLFIGPLFSGGLALLIRPRPEASN